MKRFLPLLLTLAVSLFSLGANAQWVPITNLTGTTQNYGGVNVTVTSVNGITGGGCGGLYWVQSTNASYTFTFSTPVAGVWIMVDAINTGEAIEFIIDGQFFPITNCNLDPNPFVNNCSVNNCNIVNGQFVNNTTGWVCGGIMTFYGPISSFTINQPMGGSGTTFNISFAPMGSNIGGAGAVIAGSNSPVCVGGSLNLTSSANTNNSWTGPGGFNSTLQNPIINPVTLADAGDYIVVHNGPCGVVTDTVTVVVGQPPVITSSAKVDPSTCGGSDGYITISGLVPNLGYTITYDINGTPQSVNVVADVNGNLIVTGLTQGGYMNLSVTSGNCPPVLVGNFTLTDPPLPAAPVAASNSPVCEEGTIIFSANNVTGGTFSWTGPMSFVSSQQNPSIVNAQLSYGGNYSVTVTVANCVSPATILPVTITPLPLPPVTSPVDLCQYEVATPLTATGSALLWYTTQTGGTGSATPPTPNTNTPAVTTYYVTQTQNSCESHRAALTVTVKPQPIAPVYTGPVHYCRDEPSTPLTANGQNIQWYDALNNQLSGAPTPSTLVAGDFTWYVTQTVNGCESPKTTVLIHVAEIPPSPIVADVKQCQFDAQMALTAIGQDLKWYNTLAGGSPLISAPVPATNAPLVRTWFVSQTVDGCESPRAPITVTVHFLPTSTFTPSRPLVCENDTLTFTYTGNGTPSEIYTWTLPDSATLISGTTNTPGPLVIRWDSIGNFPLTLNVDNQGCNTTYTYNVKAVVVPVVTISMPTDVCINDSVKVGIGGYNSTIASYTWAFDGGTNVFNNINEGPYQVRWDGTGLRQVSVTVSNTACETTSWDTVLIHAKPDAHFTSSVSTLCIGDSVRLSAVDNNGLYSYEWTPERFFSSTNNFAPVVNAYVLDGQEITLTINTPYGCTATESMLLDAQSCCVVSLPNVFTPNGDGKNDVFRPITTGTHAIKRFIIVNRWGTKVFETQDEKVGWDGTYNGVDQNIDTYYYILQYKCNGKTQELKGDVTLVR